MVLDINAQIGQNLMSKSKRWVLIMACKWDVRFLIYVLRTVCCQHIHRSQILLWVLSVICVQSNVEKHLILSSSGLRAPWESWCTSFESQLIFVACGMCFFKYQRFWALILILSIKTIGLPRNFWKIIAILYQRSMRQANSVLTLSARYCQVLPGTARYCHISPCNFIHF